MKKDKKTTELEAQTTYFAVAKHEKEHSSSDEHAHSAHNQCGLLALG
jgi:hypothetical protein